jgi:fibronectin-binding autotransporter adhesin
MAKKYYNYGALSVGATFTTADTTKASAIGATTTAITNGTLTVSSDAPTGLVNSVEGTTQSVSGTCYITETITATGVLSVSIYWKMPTSVGTLGAALFFAENAGNRQMAMTLLSTEQMRFQNASGVTLFDTTFSGGFVAGQWYRTDFHLTQGTTTTGRLVANTYTEHSNTPLTGTTYDSGTTVDMGTLTITKLRHGPRAATSTADENIRVRMGYDPASAYLMGPQLAATSTIAGSGTLTTTGVVGKTTTASLAGTGSLTAAGVVGTVASATIAGTGTLTAAGTAAGSGVNGASTLSGTGSLAASGVVGKVSSASITGTGTFTDPGVVGKLGSATVAGTGTFTTTKVLGLTGSATILGSGSLSSAGSAGKVASATVAGTGTILADSTPVLLTSDALLDGVGHIVATGVVSRRIGGTLAGTGTILAGGYVSLTSTATVTGTGSIAVSGAVHAADRDITVVVYGPLSESHRLTGPLSDTLKLYGPIGE